MIRRRWADFAPRPSLITFVVGRSRGSGGSRRRKGTRMPGKKAALSRARIVLFSHLAAGSPPSAPRERTSCFSSTRSCTRSMESAWADSQVSSAPKRSTSSWTTTSSTRRPTLNNNKEESKRSRLTWPKETSGCHQYHASTTGMPTFWGRLMRSLQDSGEVAEKSTIRQILQTLLLARLISLAPPSKLP